MSDWISVDDQLPEDFQVVLAFIVSGGLADIDPPMMDVISYIPQAGGFRQSVATADSVDDETVIVTHWMPLPPPPESTGDSNDN